MMIHFTVYVTCVYNAVLDLGFLSISPWRVAAAPPTWRYCPIMRSSRISFPTQGIQGFQNQFPDHRWGRSVDLNWTASSRVDLEATIRFQPLGTATTSGQDIHFSICGNILCFKPNLHSTYNPVSINSFDILFLFFQVRLMMTPSLAAISDWPTVLNCTVNAGVVLLWTL
jgi:hypothetical protein